MPGSVIVGGARTPIGKLSGALKNLTAMDLGGIAIAAALRKAGRRAPVRSPPDRPQLTAASP
jgi:acetyl-CoA acetyltransferase